MTQANDVQLSQAMTDSQVVIADSQDLPQDKPATAVDLGDDGLESSAAAGAKEAEKLGSSTVSCNGVLHISWSSAANPCNTDPDGCANSICLCLSSSASF
jgi:hypothetical protein